jgi:hypothetical protein
VEPVVQGRDAQRLSSNDCSQRAGGTPEQTPGSRSQCRGTLVVQGSGTGCTRQVVDAGTEPGHRRQLRPGERQDLPLHSDSGQRAVDVHGAPVTTCRGIDLEVDVEPPPLVVGAVAVVAVQDADERSVTVQRHLPQPRADGCWR